MKFYVIQNKENSTYFGIPKSSSVRWPRTPYLRNAHWFDDKGRAIAARNSEASPLDFRIVEISFKTVG